MDDTHQIVGDFVGLEDIGSKGKVGGCARTIGRLHRDDGDFGLRGQIAADLIDFGADLRQCLGRVVVQLQSDRDGGDAQFALGGDIVDAIGRGDGLFQWGGDEATHQFRIRAHIDGADDDLSVLVSRVLANGER